MLLPLLVSSAFAAAPATLLACPDSPSGTSDLLARAVRIETSVGSGSGVVISPDGFILTAAHVTSGASEVDVVMHDGAKVKGQVLRSQALADLALLRVDVTGLGCAPLATERPDVGSDVRIIGSPGGEALTNSVTKGIISGFREAEGWTVLQTDASVNAGSSGGMVADASGHVAGIVSFKAVGLGVEGLGFASATENVAKALDITFGDATDAEVPVIEDTSESTVATHVAEMTHRPKDPGAPFTGKKLCRDVEIKDDAFGDGTQVVGRGADMFILTWKSGSDPIFTAKLSPLTPLGMQANFVEPGGMQLDIALMDGTRIHMVSMGGRMTASAMGGLLTFDFPMTPEIVAAMAASGPKALRWTSGGASYDQDRSDRQREKYYLPVFACVNQQIQGAAE